MCPGSPVKLSNYTYSLEKVLRLDKSVDLETGSIEFPGDVIITKNVMDGLHVHSRSRLDIKGLVSGAELKAENGINIEGNAFNTKIVLGERHYNHTEFLNILKGLEKRLNSFIEQIDYFLSSSQ